MCKLAQLMTALQPEPCLSEIRVFPLLNGSASYSAISSYNMLREVYGGLKSTLRIRSSLALSSCSQLLYYRAGIS